MHSCCTHFQRQAQRKCATHQSATMAGTRRAAKTRTMMSRSRSEKTKTTTLPATMPAGDALCRRQTPPAPSGDPQARPRSNPPRSLSSISALERSRVALRTTSCSSHPGLPCQQIVDVVGHALTWVLVWLPHILWRRHGIPPQPPCPRHGFDCKCGAGAGVDRPSFAAPHANTQPTPNTKAPGSARLKVRLQRAALARSLLMGDLEAAIAHHTGSEWTFTVAP